MKEVEVFKALGDEGRLKILSMLSQHELCACDIQDTLNLTQPTISHHMRILQKAGLVEVEKRGKWAFYTLNKDAFHGLQDYLKDIISPTDEENFPISKCDCDGFRK
ncbi:ArsR/SmtB family transcription factor [Alkaliphilus serpentinus]|uniref:ArsR/SmtB family transcription factor n=1 Tax=Alkaliphilus serpentinus TaxID=1482731 RepID=UPI001FAAC2D0|nr:metalloregulator ArsR/SmtB family transcription factor [Alkaliphilus serpentinus]